MPKCSVRTPTSFGCSSGAFEMAALPNRAELRLKPTDKVIGYTLSLVRDQHEAPIGAALFFKDLTHVEQMEERERLRDRLAALGQMAAAMAHEIKNPLAGIEVMAGLLRRQLSDNAGAQAIVIDIINEAKMANAIVQEMLEFVRPVRLQLDRASVGEALRNALTLAEGKAKRGEIVVDLQVRRRSTRDSRRSIPADPGVRQFADQRLRSDERTRGGPLATRIIGAGDEGALLPDGHHAVATMLVEIGDNGPGVPAELTDKIFSPFFTTKAQGSGLGLAIVRKIIDAHEGRIDMTSSATGTCFR